MVRESQPSRSRWREASKEQLRGSRLRSVLESGAIMANIVMPVSELPVAEKELAPLKVREPIELFLRRRLEAFALSDSRLVLSGHARPFAAAAQCAFYEHYPLVITPDDIWFCIA